MRLESEGVLRDLKASSLGTKIVMPSSVSLAWAWKVSMTLVDSSNLRNVENGPATESSSVRFTLVGAGAGAGVGVLEGGEAVWAYDGEEHNSISVLQTMKTMVNSIVSKMI